MSRKPQPPELVEYRNSDDDRIWGYWVGEPHRSSFIQVEEVQDGYGLTDGAKRRIKGRHQALTAIAESMRKPQIRDPELAAKPPLLQSETPSPFPWGTLEYWRDRAMRAEDRGRLLESECDSLLEAQREHEAALVYLVEAPAANALALSPASSHRPAM